MRKNMNTGNNMDQTRCEMLITKIQGDKSHSIMLLVLNWVEYKNIDVESRQGGLVRTLSFLAWIGRLTGLQYERGFGIDWRRRPGL